MKEVCREYGISDATYHTWKAKYGGIEIADVQKLKELGDGNRRLKKCTPISASSTKRSRISLNKSPEACSQARACRLRTAGARDQSTSGV